MGRPIVSSTMSCLRTFPFPPALTATLKPSELELALIGNREIKVKDWAKTTKFDGDKELKDRFWKAVESMDLEDQAKLLMFWTSCSTVPRGGFGRSVLYGSCQLPACLDL